MKNLNPQETLKIMELVAEITAAAVRNPGWNTLTIDKLVRTLFPTMCELLEKVN